MFGNIFAICCIGWVLNVIAMVVGASNEKDPNGPQWLAFAIPISIVPYLTSVLFGAGWLLTKFGPK